MDAIQALFLALKLPLLRDDNARRAALAAQYLSGLQTLRDARGTVEKSPVPEALVPDAPGISAWHALVVKSPQRAALMRRLRERGVGHQIYYPAALPDLPAWKAFARRDCPVARALARTGLALPLHPGLRKAEIADILGALNP
jgi:dTDP-4-amino-4,6-dideoxygalactose transaminase